MTIAASSECFVQWNRARDNGFICCRATLATSKCHDNFVASLGRALTRRKFIIPLTLPLIVRGRLLREYDPTLYHGGHPPIRSPGMHGRHTLAWATGQCQAHRRIMDTCGKPMSWRHKLGEVLCDELCIVLLSPSPFTLNIFLFRHVFGAVSR